MNMARIHIYVFTFGSNANENAYILHMRRAAVLQLYFGKDLQAHHYYFHTQLELRWLGRM